MSKRMTRGYNVTIKRAPEESEVMSEYEAREAIARAVKRCFDRIPKELVEELTKPMKYAGV